MSSEQQAELVAGVRELMKLLEHYPSRSFERWCFKSLSRDGKRFDDVMDRIAAAMADTPTTEPPAKEKG